MGLATGRLADGVAASAGALIVGFANLGGGYRVRAATLLATTLAAGVAALVGGFTGPSVLATVVALGVWGFAQRTNGGSWEQGRVGRDAVDVGAATGG